MKAKDFPQYKTHTEDGKPITNSAVLAESVKKLQANIAAKKGK